MTATGRDVVHRVLRVMVDLAACTALCALTILGATALATDRSTLTGQLVPVTGETSRSVDLAVPFAKNSANLADAARLQLDELGAALAGERLAPYDVGVYGHTDASGAAAYNLTLSQARAQAVVRYLVERFGFEAARFRHDGYGEERLLEGLDPNDAAHRRVEIVVFAPLTRTPAAAEGADVFGTDSVDFDQEESDDASGQEGTGYQPIQ